MWNLTIMGTVLSVVLMNVVVFKTLSGKRQLWARLLKVICVLLFIPLALTILIPNVFWILSPLTPAVHGKIIDSETGRGLPNARVIVAWRRLETTIGGGSRPPYKTLGMTTNENGDFRVPCTVKALSLNFIWGFAEYGGMSIFAYDFDHEGVMGAEDASDGNLMLVSKPIKADSEYLANMSNIQSRIFFQINESDKSILKEELFQLITGYRLFGNKYPQSTLHEEGFSKLSSIYAQTNSKVEELEFWQEYLQKYPTGKRAEYGRDEIKWLMHWINKEKKGK